MKRLKSILEVITTETYNPETSKYQGAENTFQEKKKIKDSNRQWEFCNTLKDHDEGDLFLISKDRHVKIGLCSFLKGKSLPGRMT